MGSSWQTRNQRSALALWLGPFSEKSSCLDEFLMSIHIKILLSQLHLYNVYAPVFTVRAAIICNTPVPTYWLFHFTIMLLKCLELKKIGCHSQQLTGLMYYAKAIKYLTFLTTKLYTPTAHPAFYAETCIFKVSLKTLREEKTMCKSTKKLRKQNKIQSKTQGTKS